MTAFVPDYYLDKDKRIELLNRIQPRFSKILHDGTNILAILNSSDLPINEEKTRQLVDILISGLPKNIGSDGRFIYDFLRCDSINKQTKKDKLKDIFTTLDRLEFDYESAYHTLMLDSAILEDESKSIILRKIKHNLSKWFKTFRGPEFFKMLKSENLNHNHKHELLSVISHELLSRQDFGQAKMEIARLLMQPADCFNQESKNLIISMCKSLSLREELITRLQKTPEFIQELVVARNEGLPELCEFLADKSIPLVYKLNFIDMLAKKIESDKTLESYYAILNACLSKYPPIHEMNHYSSNALDSHIEKLNSLYLAEKQQTEEKDQVYSSTTCRFLSVPSTTPISASAPVVASDHNSGSQNEHTEDTRSEQPDSKL